MEPEETVAEELDDRISTLFFQGNMSARFQGAKYCGRHGMNLLLPDGTHATATVENAPLLLHNCVPLPELGDVGYGWSWNPVHWPFMLGSRASNMYHGIENAPTHHVFLSELNVGGSQDVLQHQAMLRRCVKEEVEGKGRQLVLFGCSRGAATTFVSLATIEESLLPSVRLAIVEAPFDSVESVLAESSYTPNLQLLLLQTFTKYSAEQLTPLAACETFPLNVPVAFITSEQDTRVPRACTQRLIDRLRERGHQHLHHLELKNSAHSSMPHSDPDDRRAYLRFVSELYKLYIV